jgi:HlyD family secretion protein
LTMPQSIPYFRDMRRYLLTGAAVTMLLVGGVAGWAATTEISGAVIAPGRVVVLSEVKKVQHLTGGIVGTILVREGEQVVAGQPLLRLDDTVTRSNLAIISRSLEELMMGQARLRAERDGQDSVVFPPELLARTGYPETARMIESEQRLFDLRRVARNGNRGRLEERKAQFEQEIWGLGEQIESKTQELQLISNELEGARELWTKKLIQMSRLNALERESVRISGQRSDIYSRIAETRGRIAEIELQILQIERDFNSNVAMELREVDAKIGELAERRVAAEEQLKRVVLESPVAGIIHQLAVHTVGGVIGPGEIVMQIVPVSDDLEVEAKVNPADIDQLHLGAPARLRLSAFNQRTTPELVATLESIAADVTTEERTGATYYRARLLIPHTELTRLGKLKGDVPNSVENAKAGVAG